MPRPRKPATADQEVVPTSVRFPPHLREALGQEAREQKRPMTYIVNEILEQWFAYKRAAKKAKT